MGTGVPLGRGLHVEARVRTGTGLGVGVRVGAGVHVGAGVYAQPGALLCKAGEGPSGVLSHDKPASTTHLSLTHSQYVRRITSPVLSRQACPGTKQPQSPLCFPPAILQSLFSPKVS